MKSGGIFVGVAPWPKADTRAPRGACRFESWRSTNQLEQLIFCSFSRPELGRATHRALPRLEDRNGLPRKVCRPSVQGDFGGQAQKTGRNKTPPHSPTLRNSRKRWRRIGRCSDLRQAPFRAQHARAPNAARSRVVVLEFEKIASHYMRSTVSMPRTESPC